ncbi:hypothetical protein MRB53_016402 [Persea americana]|uniref:Uncharacterized protein n=1 Tax=Persea americana TaxID=3435 RepID=A0ACC2M2Q8_PERAE|nr:hypothetical protein MRB53_016402 [Persea americana]
MYSKTSLHQHSRYMFDKMPHRNVPTWNALISNSVLDGRPREANDEDERVLLTFLLAWEAGVKPMDFVVSSILSTCAGLARLEFEKFVHKT